MRGLLLALAILALLAPAAAAAVDHDASCGGFAPLETTCRLGPHVTGTIFGVGVSYGCLDLPTACFVGDIGVTVTWSGGSVTMVCASVVLPAFGTGSCMLPGGIPPAGTVVEARCDAAQFGTISAADPDGEPAAVGGWGCRFIH